MPKPRPMAPDIGGDRGGRSSQTAYATIKAKILNSELAPGSQVTEQALAEELGMSRTPVREAAIRLQEEGLLAIVPRHGVQISSLLPSDMREIYEILLSLEPTAVELLTLRQPGPDVLAPLIAACDRMEEALNTEPPKMKVWAEADAEFHGLLTAMCGNKRLAAMVMTVSEQAHRARMFTLPLRPIPHQSTEEHRRVLEAILRGDARLARALYEYHRRRGAQAMMDLIERHDLRHL